MLILTSGILNRWKVSGPAVRVWIDRREILGFVIEKVAIYIVCLGAAHCIAVNGNLLDGIHCRGFLASTH